MKGDNIMQPFVNFNKRLVGTQKIEHKFDKKIRKIKEQKDREEKKAANNPGG